MGATPSGAGEQQPGAEGRACSNVPSSGLPSSDRVELRAKATLSVALSGKMSTLTSSVHSASVFSPLHRRRDTGVDRRSHVSESSPGRRRAQVAAVRWRPGAGGWRGRAFVEALPVCVHLCHLKYVLEQDGLRRHVTGLGTGSRAEGSLPHSCHRGRRATHASALRDRSDAGQERNRADRAAQPGRAGAAVSLGASVSPGAGSQQRRRGCPCAP